MRKALRLCFAAGALMMAGHGFAQEAAPEAAEDRTTSTEDGLNTIVVTATRREQSLQDVPVSVAVFDAAAIDRVGPANSIELIERVANLAFSPGTGSSNANIFLRGVGSSGIAFNLQSGVGIYADEVVLNSPVVNVLQVYDLERVEVLRGPQNTLYGRNTTGGAINFVTRQPDVGGPANGTFAATYGRFDQLDINAALGVPLGERAAVRIALQSQDRDPLRRNLFTGLREEERDTFAMRGQLKWEASDNTTFLLKGHVERIRNGNLLGKQVGSQDPNNLAERCATPFKLGVCATPAGVVNSADPLEGASDMVRPRTFVNAGGVSGRVDIDFEAFAVTSITAWEGNSQRSSFDADGSTSPDFHFFLDNEQSQFTQEVRATSSSDQALRWIVGGFYFAESLTGSQGPLVGTPMGTMVTRSFADLDNRSYSAYGEVEWDVSDRLTLRGGARYTIDEIKGRVTGLLTSSAFLPGIDLEDSLIGGAFIPDFALLEATARANGVPVFDGGEVGAGPNRIIVVGGPADPDSPLNGTTFKNWGAMAGVDFKPNDDLLFYAKWSRGFKGGRFNPAPMSVATGDGDAVVAPEKISSFEVGMKSEFWGNRARLNASVFYNDYTDQQINQFINGVFTVTNVDSEIWGAEVELNLAPVDGFYIDASGGWLDTRVTAPLVNPEVGRELPLAPEFSGTLAARKEWDLADGSRITLGADARYLGRRRFNLANLFPEGEPYTVVNARAAYDFGRSRQYTIAVWGKNIFNEVVVIDNTEGFAILGDPVTYGATFSAKF